MKRFHLRRTLPRTAVFGLVLVMASCAGPKGDDETKYGLPSPSEDPVVTLRECIPYVEPKPGDAAAGFSLLATEGGVGVSDYWILVRQRGFSRNSQADLALDQDTVTPRDMQLAPDVPHVLRIEHKTGDGAYCRLHRYAVTLNGNEPVNLGAVKDGMSQGYFDIDMPTTVDPVNSPTISLARYYVSGGNSYSEVVLRSGTRRYRFYAY